MRTSLTHRAIILTLVSFMGLMSLRSAPTLLCKTGECVFSPGNECFNGDISLSNHVWWEGFKT